MTASCRCWPAAAASCVQCDEALAVEAVRGRWVLEAADEPGAPAPPAKPGEGVPVDVGSNDFGWRRFLR